MSANIPNPHAATPGPRVFISYRRSDSASIAGRIFDRLAAYFGRDALFKDVDDIPIGVNFEQVIASVIDASSVLLVLVGPTWATVATERGRRLDDPTDFVRLEIEAALRRGIPTIPVLVEGATMPDVATLPPSLRPLFAHGATLVRNDPWFDGDMSQLANTLVQWLPLRSAGAVPAGPENPATGPVMPPDEAAAARKPSRRRTWLATPLGLAAVAILIVAVALLGLAGVGLTGAGPFSALIMRSTPLATAPRQPTPTATPTEHVALDEALTNPQAGWDTDSECVFKSDGYHVIAPAGLIVYCASPDSYTNFHLTTRVHAPAGVSRIHYALFFRVTDTKNLDYMDIELKLAPSLAPTATTGPGGPTPTPDHSLWADWAVSSHSSGDDTVLDVGATSAAHITGDGDNILEVYANGPVFTILVNGTALGSFQDAFNDKPGKIGLGVQVGEAIYTSIRVATLG